ncbi:hypothetical protein METBIDRAFT_98523 [Metschnikowia bicuspidata var. bicuspidata NRRL YB-4993]|uniref:Uncharacterized protein n=1 Tax=Metschnikowia bicuspidata var. bicuspidata NRRL YB-4993 TaxID=869754 RepID=A0A1A0HGV7_9ASCO|nr:hypothetical protein METBIDRAFT_98523 [Metschnikowia bicuspidata var. bicuspidata NRRL YB-4993]OBA23083.1 hypothetical protein METBIDRAFT_98523 [Metschnikowia bicuspidata var. bicuspidata NRRL YB-4993]
MPSGGVLLLQFLVKPRGQSHVRGSRFRRSNRTPAEAAAVVSNSKVEPAAAAFSYDSPVVIAPQLFRSVTYWNQRSHVSFIPTPVVSLGVTPQTTGRPLLLHIFGPGPERSIEHTVFLEFFIPGLSGLSAFDFVVYESRVAPLVVGEDFWVAFKVLCQPRNVSN